MWTLRERIRTLSKFEIQFAIFTEEPFLYQEIAPKALELHKLGMNYSQITEALQFTDKTVAKAINYIQRLNPTPKWRSLSCGKRKTKTKAESSQSINGILFDEEVPAKARLPGSMINNVYAL